jgi:hypothetical protein
VIFKLTIMDERNKDEEKKDVFEIVFLSLLKTAPMNKSSQRSVIFN